MLKTKTGTSSKPISGCSTNSATELDLLLNCPESPVLEAATRKSSPISSPGKRKASSLSTSVTSLTLHSSAHHHSREAPSKRVKRLDLVDIEGTNLSGFSLGTASRVNGYSSTDSACVSDASGLPGVVSKPPRRVGGTAVANVASRSSDGEGVLLQRSRETRERSNSVEIIEVIISVARPAPPEQHGQLFYTPSLQSMPAPTHSRLSQLSSKYFPNLQSIQSQQLQPLEEHVVQSQLSNIKPVSIRQEPLRNNQDLIIPSWKSLHPGRRDSFQQTSSRLPSPLALPQRHHHPPVTQNHVSSANGALSPLRRAHRPGELIDVRPAVPPLLPPPHVLNPNYINLILPRSDQRVVAPIESASSGSEDYFDLDDAEKAARRRRKSSPLKLSEGGGSSQIFSSLTTANTKPSQNTVLRKLRDRKSIKSRNQTVEPIQVLEKIWEEQFEFLSAQELRPLSGERDYSAKRPEYVEFSSRIQSRIGAPGRIWKVSNFSEKSIGSPCWTGNLVLQVIDLSGNDSE